MCSSRVVLFHLCRLGGLKTSTGVCDVVQSTNPVGELLWGLGRSRVPGVGLQPQRPVCRPFSFAAVAHAFRVRCVNVRLGLQEHLGRWVSLLVHLC